MFSQAKLILSDMKRAVCVLLIFVVSGFARTSPKSEVRKTLDQFVTAFDNLDRDQFLSFFSADATLFQPRKFNLRAENKAAIAAQFREVFENIRGSQRKPPYMDLRPLNLRIQMLGDNVAIVSFHLDDRPAVVNRRTIVWYRTKSGWKIVHIHASELPLNP